jgi:hypothetical protein
MAAKYIEARIISPSIIDESEDKIRSALGGYYSLVTSSQIGDSYVFQDSTSPQNPSNIYNSSVLYSTGSILLSSVYSLDSYYGGIGNAHTASSESFLPNVRIPIVLVGNSGSFENDIEWSTYINGGEYNTSSYSGILTEGVFEQLNWNKYMLYNLYDLKQIVSGNYGDYKYFDASYKYNYYMKEYEQKTRSTPETLLPHFDILRMNSKGNYQDPVVTKFANLDGVIEDNDFDMNGLFTTHQQDTLPLKAPHTNNTSPGVYNNDQYNFQQYLHLYNNTVISGTLADDISRQLQNVFYDPYYMLEPFEVADMKDKFPWYAEINIPFTTAKTHQLVDAMHSMGLEPYFMRLFKEEFVDNKKPTTQILNKEMDHIQLKSGSVRDYSTISTSELPYIDLLPKLFQRIQHGSPSDKDNYIFLTGDENRRELFSSVDTHYSQIWNGRLMRYINEATEFLYRNYDPLSWINDPDTNLSTLLDKASEEQHMQVMGYRIEKISPRQTSTGTGLVSISNQFIPWTNELPGFTMWGNHEDEYLNLTTYDTQVKYGEDYIYAVYEYVAVVGYRYSYENWTTTRKIGNYDIPNSDDAGHCLEFVDIATGQPSTAPRQEFTSLFANNFLTLYTMLSSSNPYAKDAQVWATDSFRYLCQMDYVLEPFIRVYQVPVATKYVSITDHPPVAPDITPYQKLDDSQTIGFFYNRDSFVERPYPAVLNGQEEIERKKYLTSNSYYNSENITAQSTDPHFLEIYRVSSRPTSYKDFDNNLVTTVSLKEKDLKLPYKSGIFEHKIETNTTYYYIFRFLNAHRQPGRFSPVIQTELVSDGGYKYSLFEIYSEEKITRKTPVNQPSKALKKIFQVIPNPNQLILTGDLDYSQTAASQYNKVVVGSETLEESIWDKKFKIRLISKKTGKKLDINVTYEVNKG